MSRLAERSGPSVIWAAAEEITPPASSDQPASGASAPCRVKRRNVKAVARAGPASGTETDTALAHKRTEPADRDTRPPQ